MGNSRSSHSFSKSRSVSLSDIPYKQDNKSYVTKTKSRPVSFVSESPTQLAQTNDKPNKSTNRSKSFTSLGDKSNNRLSASSGSGAAVKQKSAIDANQQLREKTATRQRPLTSRQSSKDLITGTRQYNDEYLQPDIRKLFKAHDKRNTKALVDEVDTSTMESLDKKLAKLKQQRAGDNTAVEDQKQKAGDKAAEDSPIKKSKKTKRAPSLPTIETKSSREGNTAPDKSLLKNGNAKSKSNSLLKKKSPAPPPPSLQVTLEDSESLRVNDNNNNANDDGQKAVLDIDACKGPRVSTGEESAQSQTQGADIPPTTQVATNGKLQTGESVVSLFHSTNSVESATLVERKLTISKSTSVDKEPCSSVSPNHEKLINSSKDSVESTTKPIIGCDPGNTAKFPATKKHKKAPKAPSTINILSSVDMGSSASADTQTDAISKDTLIQATEEKVVENSEVLEKKEAAVQLKQSIDMAVQCDENIVKEQGGEPADVVKPADVVESTDRSEPADAGVVLQLYIDKNTEKNGSNSSDESARNSVSCHETTQVAIEATSSVDTEIKANTSNRQSNVEAVEEISAITTSHSLAAQNSTSTLQTSTLTKQTSTPTIQTSTPTVQTPTVEGPIVQASTLTIQTSTSPIQTPTVQTTTVQTSTVQTPEVQTSTLTEADQEDSAQDKSDQSDTNSNHGNKCGKNSENPTLCLTAADNEVSVLNDETSYNDQLQKDDHDNADKEIENLVDKSDVSDSSTAQLLSETTISSSDKYDVIATSVKGQPQVQTSTTQLLVESDTTVIKEQNLPENEVISDLEESVRISTSLLESDDFGQCDTSDPSQYTTRKPEDAASLPFAELKPSSHFSVASTNYAFPADSEEEHREHKRHKSKFGGIFRITKTMRRFMSSVGKHSPKLQRSEDTVEQHSSGEDEEEPNLSSVNWVLADNSRKATPRKEYKPTWNEDTFKNPNDTSMFEEQNGQSSTPQLIAAPNKDMSENQRENLLETDVNKDVIQSEDEVNNSFPKKEVINSDEDETQVRKRNIETGASSSSVKDVENERTTTSSNTCDPHSNINNRLALI